MKGLISRNPPPPTFRPFQGHNRQDRQKPNNYVEKHDSQTTMIMTLTSL